jgi:hypothetical protein
MNKMHPIAFRKAMIEAYLAGAEAISSGDIYRAGKEEAREWFDNEYGLTVTEQSCDCCEETED